MSDEAAQAHPPEGLGLPAQVRAGWRGRQSLSWAFWGFHFGGGLLLLTVAVVSFLLLIPSTYSEDTGVLGSPIFRAYALAISLVYLCYSVASAVIVWRCAENAAWPGWKYAARAGVVLWVVQLLRIISAMAMEAYG